MIINKNKIGILILIIGIIVFAFDHFVNKTFFGIGFLLIITGLGLALFMSNKNDGKSFHLFRVVGWAIFIMLSFFGLGALIFRLWVLSNGGW